MLRNGRGTQLKGIKHVFLNEVLSLNAQESFVSFSLPTACAILNEVLSLNAQEFTARLLVFAVPVSSMKS